MIRKFLFVLLAFIINNALGQVKMGDNPTTIDQNSVLELESTNKGLIIPRITLTSVSSTSPLTAPVVTSTLIYNTGGSEAAGYYYWDGSQWIRLYASNSEVGDHDWYEVGTTSPPDNINDNQYTQGNLGIGATSPSRQLEINNSSSTTPPMRLTQQGADNTATSVSGATSKALVVDTNGDVRTTVNVKHYTPNTCGCVTAPPFPNTFPADMTYFSSHDSNWSGNGITNSTLADWILPTPADALSAGHKYGDIVVIHRASSYTVVLGTDNTDLSAVLSIPANTSVGFILAADEWHRVF